MGYCKQQLANYYLTGYKILFTLFYTYKALISFVLLGWAKQAELL